MGLSDDRHDCQPRIALRLYRRAAAPRQPRHFPRPVGIPRPAVFSPTLPNTERTHAPVPPGHRPTSLVSDRRSGHFSPSWLPSVRFTSVEKRPDRLSFNAQGLASGLPAMFFEEVKRSAASHDEKNRRRSPHSTSTGDDRVACLPGSNFEFKWDAGPAIGPGPCYKAAHG
jgi:hypothetical protein